MIRLLNICPILPNCHYLFFFAKYVYPVILLYLPPLLLPYIPPNDNNTIVALHVSLKEFHLVLLKIRALTFCLFSEIIEGTSFIHKKICLLKRED